MSPLSDPDRPDLRVERRGFLGLLAGAPILGSLGVIGGSADGALGNSDRARVARSVGRVPAIDPRSAALLVMDYQLAWIKTLSHSDALLSRAAVAISTARERGVPVAYTRVAFTPADYAAVPARNIIFSRLASRPGALDDGSPAMSVDGRVAPEPGDKVVRKTRVGAFARTDLDEWLRALSVDTLILTGISTSGVVLSTVCDAADRDYRVVVVSDACADRDPQIQHVLIHKIFPQRAQIVTVADLPKLLRHSSHRAPKRP